jgi:hypothetical protein
MNARVSEALDEDRAELLGIASSMEDTVPQLAERLGLWRDFLAKGTTGAASPLAAEDVLEQATRAIRHIWLQAAASSTSKSYRSPTEDERTVTPTGRFHNFGYERDLQPDALERRCKNFFSAPPSGWPQDHVLFSSGQAAMTAVLTLLFSRQDGALRLHHAGCYFETVNLLTLFAGRFENVVRTPILSSWSRSRATGSSLEPCHWLNSPRMLLRMRRKALSSTARSPA